MILEVPTYEELLNSCLQNIPNNIDKREGSIIFNAIAPCCLELSNLYHKLQNAIDLIFLDTSAGDYLDRYVNQFNFKRNKATQALRKGEFNIEIPIDSMFSDGNLSYEVIERIGSTFNYILKCTTYGNVGNNYRGSLTPISYINNLTRAELTDIIKIGQDIEDDDSVRARFIEYIKRPEFGGNISDYKKKALSLNNVGGVKVIPVWNGAGTVKLILSSTNFLVFSLTLLLSFITLETVCVETPHSFATSLIVIFFIVLLPFIMLPLTIIVYPEKLICQYIKNVNNH